MEPDAAKQHHEQQQQQQQQPTSAAEHTPSVVSPDSSPPPQQASAWNSPTPGSSSRISSTFEFTSAPSDVSVPSFDPAIAAFADMSFTQPHVPSPYMQDRKPVPSGSNPAQQPDCFQRRDMHDKKRFKADPDTPALDSIDYWINFDDDWDKMGSVEIDYSKRNDPIYNNRQVLPLNPPSSDVIVLLTLDKQGRHGHEHNAWPGQWPLLHHSGAIPRRGLHRRRGL